VHHDDALLGNSELRYFGALLLRSRSQLVETFASASTGSRSADRCLGFPEGSNANATQMDGALLQSEAMDRNAVGRAFRPDGRAPTAGRGYSCLLSRAAVK